MTAEDDLSALLAVHIDRFDDLLATEGMDAILTMPLTMSMSCAFDVDFTDFETNEPSLEAHAHVEPGGTVTEASLEARLDDASASVDIEPDTALHQALQRWFTDMWDSGDEVLEGTASGVVMGVRVADLRVGDRVWRLDLTVAGVESAGINTAGEHLLAVYFEDNPGREVWSVDRSLTIIRDGDGKSKTIKVTRQQVAAARIVSALDQAEGRESDEWIQRLTQAGQED